MRAVEVEVFRRSREGCLVRTWYLVPGLGYVPWLSWLPRGERLCLCDGASSAPRQESGDVD